MEQGEESGERRAESQEMVSGSNKEMVSGSNKEMVSGSSPTPSSMDKEMVSGSSPTPLGMDKEMVSGSNKEMVSGSSPTPSRMEQEAQSSEHRAKSEELTDDQKMVLDLLIANSPVDLNSLKEQAGLSNKKWDKAIKGLTGNKLAKVEKTEEGLVVSLI